MKEAGRSTRHWREAALRWGRSLWRRYRKDPAAGRLLILALLLIGIVLIPLTAPSRHAPRPTLNPTLSPTEASATGVASPAVSSHARKASAAPSAAASSQPSPQPSPAATVPPPARQDADGMAHSDASGDGTWAIAPAPAVTPTGSWQAHYLLRVEGGTHIDAAEIAPTIASVLNDPRGWPAVKGVSFVPVTDPAAADFTLNVATPATVDQLCAPMAVNGTWSCRNGNTVNLNSDRWNYLVPWIPDVTTYRSYLINHEVGHWLGYGHLTCGGAGLYAPTMMQQSKGLGECIANPWPTQDGQKAQ